MSTQVYLTRDALADFAEPGDVIVNFTSDSIAASVPSLSFSPDGLPRLTQGAAYPVSCDTPDIDSLQAILSQGNSRLVVVADGSAGGDEFMRRLASTNLPYVVCMLEESCAADAFMDEEDSEAVAERLRQLGYI